MSKACQIILGKVSDKSYPKKKWGVCGDRVLVSRAASICWPRSTTCQTLLFHPPFIGGRETMWSARSLLLCALPGKQYPPCKHCCSEHNSSSSLTKMRTNETPLVFPIAEILSVMAAGTTFYHHGVRRTNSEVKDADHVYHQRNLRDRIPSSSKTLCRDELGISNLDHYYGKISTCAPHPSGATR